LARAKAAIASSANASAIGFDLDLDDGGIFFETARGERLPTARATGFLGRKYTFFADDGQVGIISTVGKFLPFLLATTSWWYSGCCGIGGSIGGRGRVLGERVGSRGTCQVIGRVPRLTLGAKQTLLENAVLGFEFGNAGFEIRLAFPCSFKPGAIIASLLSGLKEQWTIGAMRARQRRKWIREGRGRFASRRRQSGGSGPRSGWGRFGPFRPRPFGLFVVGCDHPTRRARSWCECQFHSSTLSALFNLRKSFFTFSPKLYAGVVASLAPRRRSENQGTRAKTAAVLS
jgi:hypothetical protein